MKTPGQVSELLEIPPSTLRRWASLFGEYLSEQANRYRRSYTAQDVATFEHIKELSSRGILLKDIPEHLDNVVIADDQPAENTSALLATKDAQQLRSVLAQLRSDQEDTDQRLDDLNRRMDGLIDLIIEKLLPPGEH